jgi:hypothetical protein
MSECTYRRWVVVAWIVIATPLLLSLSRFAAGAERAPFLVPAKAGTRCVLEPWIMRTHHMSLLKERRDQVVRGGLRAQGHGTPLLESCAQCHTNRENFCDSCHSRASVHLDCFGCHTYGHR